MKSWLALGEPRIILSVRLPRCKSRDERLRERAEAHVRLSFEKYYGAKELQSQLHSRLELRVVTLLNERQAIRAAMKRVPRRRVFLRRELLRQLLWKHGIAKWW